MCGCVVYLCCTGVCWVEKLVYLNIGECCGGVRARIRRIYSLYNLSNF